MTLAQKIVNLLKNAKESDLDSFDAEINKCEARLKALRQAREVLAEEVLNRSMDDEEAPTPTVKVSVKKEVTPRLSFNGSQVHGGASTEELTKEIAEFILHNGPCMRRKVCSTLGISEEVANRILDQKDFFEKNAQVYNITQEARIKYDPKHSREDL